MIGILNYGAGNLRSVENALDRISVSYFISDNPEELEKAEKIIFPGVGHAKAAMAILQEKKLDILLQKTKQPVLGICLGMQLLFDYSEEGETKCLGIIPGKITKFDATQCGKVPHMGWNKVNLQSSGFNLQFSKKAPFVKGGAPKGWGILGTNNEDTPFVYFIHSYYAPLNNHTIMTCDYGGDFSASVQKDNFIGMQFHPEKSGKVGETILQNFCSMK